MNLSRAERRALLERRFKTSKEVRRRRHDTTAVSRRLKKMLYLNLHRKTKKPPPALKLPKGWKSV